MTEIDFGDIAPHPDEELQSRVRKLLKQPELLDAACALMFPPWLAVAKPLLRRVIRHRLLQKVAHVRDRAHWNDLLTDYVRKVLENTSSGFTFSGVADLPSAPCIFISNHRDITLDPILVNYALWQTGLATTQIAIGDNLVNGSFESEFMRVNNSFIVVRSAKGVRAQYAAMKKTSMYIRQMLEDGQSIWIAQREGRSKDGVDKTDPAILKMFTLAFENQSRDASHLASEVNLVPTSFTYEIDPCAPLKAKELAAKERFGEYEKDPGEDRESMALGIMGFKGRIHLSLSDPVKGQFDSFDQLAQKIDQYIFEGRQSYEIFHHAAAEIEGNATLSNVPDRVLRAFNQQLSGLDETQKRLLLAQYANQIVPDSNYSS